jgi:hypothetical protein
MRWAPLLGPRSPHGADMGTRAAHPAADTIPPVPQAVGIGAATVVAMVMAGVVAQPAEPVEWVGADMAATAAAGEPLLPAAVVTTIMPAVAAAVTIITGLLHPAAAIGRRAALRAAGTRIFG